MAKPKGGKGCKPQYPANKPTKTGNKSGGGRSNNTAKGGGKSPGAKVKNKPSSPYNRGRYFPYSPLSIDDRFKRNF